MEMPLKIYNTLTRKKETFKPIHDKEVRMYTCGPTVYSNPHIGNMRAYIFADLLKRVFLYNNYKVLHVINVTDVGHLTSDADEGEDKIEKAAKKENKTAKEITEYYFSVFKKDFEKLNILPPDYWPKASEHINEQIELIKKLEKKGFTYKTSDGIYFDSSKFKDYGKMARLKISNLKAGKRVALGEKKNKTDFALWKFSSKNSKRQQEWNSPWGVGFPGWHIECSAMSMKYLGETFDVHTGGEDHIPVHHTNEIAQSESATGKKFVNYWMHVAFLLFNNLKVSKSTGGLYTLSELEEMGYDSIHFRYLCLLTHYRKQLNFTLENLDASKITYERIKRKIIELKKQKHKGEDLGEFYERKFHKAINSELNIPLAVQIFQKALDDFDFVPDKKYSLLLKFDSVLGLKIGDIKETEVVVSSEIEKIIREREELRKQKKWEKADILRERIREKGYEIEDSPQGPKLIKI